MLELNAKSDESKKLKLHLNLSMSISAISRWAPIDFTNLFILPCDKKSLRICGDNFR